MSKPKLNIREMIRSGEIDTAKAGQLVTINYYTKNGLISDSDERALRETAKDARLYNAYMAGGRELREAEIFLIALSSEAKLGIQKLAWIGAELKYTIETYYQPPRVVALTEEAYERIGKEKRERRLKRTYTLVTLYRILAENLIKYPETKAEETALSNLKKYPEDATGGNVYGIDLIDPDGKGDVVEYWRRWKPYYNRPKDTIADLAEEIPEAHALIMGRLQALYKAKKLTINPESTALDKYHETELKGSELTDMETDIKLLQDLLNLTEWTLLDDYKDKGEDEQTADNRSIFEKYMQSYAIFKTPESISPYKLKDGVIDPHNDTLDRPLSWGYRGGDTKDKIGAKMPLETIKSNREAIGSNLYILYAFNGWRQKAGQLLGVIKTDEFKSMTEHLDAKDLYHTYEVHRRLLIDHINAQSYILPEYRDYTEEIIKLYQPIGDNSENYNAFLNAPNMEAVKGQDPVGDIFKANKYVAKALEHIEGVTIHSLADSFYELRDILQPILDSKYKTPEKLDSE